MWPVYCLSDWHVQEWLIKEPWNFSDPRRSGLPANCGRTSPTPGYTWFSGLQLSPRELLSSKINIEAKAEGSFEDLLSVLQGHREAFTENDGNEEPMVQNQSPWCPSAAVLRTLIHYEQESFVNRSNFMLSIFWRLKGLSNQHGICCDLLYLQKKKKGSVLSAQILGIHPNGYSTSLLLSSIPLQVGNFAPLNYS